LNTGKVVQVIGPVVDVKFEENLPAIYNSMGVNLADGSEIVLEAIQHVGNGIVRCVAMSLTDGLVRGAEVRDTGSPITIPVGPATLGRMVNVLGKAIGPFTAKLPVLKSSAQPPKCWKQASRLSTCFSPIPGAARLVSSAERVLARPSLLWN